MLDWILRLCSNERRGLRVERQYPQGPWVYSGDIPAELGPWEVLATPDDVSRGGAYYNAAGQLVAQRVHMFSFAQSASDFARDCGFRVVDCPHDDPLPDECWI